MTENEMQLMITLTRECDTKVISTVQALTAVVSDLTRHLEISYAQAKFWVNADPYQSSRDAITVAMNCYMESGSTGIREYFQDIQRLQDFCELYKVCVVNNLWPIRTGIIKPHSETQVREFHQIKTVYRDFEKCLKKLLSVSTQLFITIYKFPYVMLNYTAISNTIKKDPSIVYSESNGAANSLIALHAALFRFAKSTGISWVTSRGNTSDTVFTDENIEEIISIIMPEASRVEINQPLQPV